jgi:hypothetical protein
MSTLDPVKEHRFRGDFSTAQQTVLQGISPGRASSTVTAWDKWIEFTSDLGVDPFLQAFPDKIPFLQVFAQRVHSGELAASGNPIRARSVEDYIRMVGQTFLHVGSDDPRLNSAHLIDFRLQRTIAAWKKSDPPPKRVKPVPIQVIRRIASTSYSTVSSPLCKAIADMIILAFFFLLRPGEYTDNNGDTNKHPFLLEDIQLFIGDTRLNLLTDSDARLKQARFASLTFTGQKNGVRGEVIGLACSGDPVLCPVQAVIRRVLYLCQNGALPTTPLAHVYNSTDLVTAAAITICIRNAVTELGPTLGFLSHEVSARCLRAAGATALLLAQVDTDIIRLIGRWKSDEMLRYLHVQAYPLMRNYSQQMLSAGTYTLIPNHLVPMR